MPALHNALTSNPALQAAYRRALGEMSQSFSGLERGSESLQPVMDLWALPEWALLRGEVLFSRNVVTAAVAARFSSYELVNPTGSGVLVVVYNTLITNQNGNVAVDSGPAIAANPVVARGVAQDTRFPQLGEVSRASLTTGDVAAGVALSQRLLLQNLPDPTVYVIAPGRKLFGICLVVNTSWNVTLSWTERPLVANEQNP